MEAWSADTDRCEVVTGFDGETYGYACECGFGFWCDTNTALPRFCPKEYYCRTPARIEECKEGHYCKEGSVYGQRCTALQTCPKGVSRPEGSGGPLLVFVSLTIVAYVAFKIVDDLKSKSAEKASADLEEYLATLRESAASRVSPTTGGEMQPVTNDEKGGGNEAFEIEFTSLRLVLPNGVTIMRGPSGTFAPGRLTAIMGASGAGKTTIINLITGKVKKTGGEIRVNGQVVESLAKWKSRVAFVPQEDVMHRRLTVLQNVSFSANLRLPRTWTVEAKRAQIVKTLVALKLDKIEHSIIGDEYQRGISGGQRKRVNVALELVADPKVCFMDEPTSGLDSVSATELVKMLRALAESDHLTVAAVIHSPGPAAFAAFHDLCLLQTGGRPVYFGPLDDVRQYFEEIGFVQPPKSLEPIADYVMLVIAGSVDQDKSVATYVVDDDDDFDHLATFHKLWHKKCGLEPPIDDAEYDHAVALDKTWKLRITRTIRASARNWLVDYPVKLAAQLCPSSADPDRPTLNGFQVFTLCLKRAARQQYTSFRTFFSGTIFVFFVMGAFTASLAGSNLNVLGGIPPDICSKIYPQLRGDCLDLQANSYISALQFTGFIIVAASASVASATFGAEQPIYWREASTNLNTPAYFAAKVVADIPLCLCSALSVSAGFLTGFLAPMSFRDIFVAFLYYVMFGFLSGYFLSFVLPYNAVSLAGVGWAVFWALLYSGTTQVILRFAPLFLTLVSPARSSCRTTAIRAGSGPSRLDAGSTRRSSFPQPSIPTKRSAKASTRAPTSST